MPFSWLNTQNFLAQERGSYFGRGVCKFTIFVHVHLNTHGWHSSFMQVVYTLFPKLRVFVESDVACSYETSLWKKWEKFRMKIWKCSCMRPNVLQLFSKGKHRDVPEQAVRGPQKYSSLWYFFLRRALREGFHHRKHCRNIKGSFLNQA